MQQKTFLCSRLGYRSDWRNAFLRTGIGRCSGVEFCVFVILQGGDCIRGWDGSMEMEWKLFSGVRLGIEECGVELAWGRR